MTKLIGIYYISNKKRNKLRLSFINDDSNNHCIIGPNYTKLEDKQCTGIYGRYNTISEAKSVCSSDSRCQGVYDNGCDAGINDIFTCPRESIYGDSLRGSCIYNKDTVNIKHTRDKNADARGGGGT